MSRYLLNDMEGIIRGLRSVATNAAALHRTDLSTRLQNCTFAAQSSNAVPSLLRQMQVRRATHHCYAQITHCRSFLRKYDQ
nr:MAHS [Milnesium sp. 1 JF-2023a]WPK49559.1 MAHS [Milnesium sp. 2 JF-2023a]